MTGLASGPKGRELANEYQTGPYARTLAIFLDLARQLRNSKLAV